MSGYPYTDITNAFLYRDLKKNYIYIFPDAIAHQNCHLFFCYLTTVKLFFSMKKRNIYLRFLTNDLV
jgi:hypothetical protein